MTDTTYRLRLQSGPESGREYELNANSITIGRYPLADIVINDPDISYRHAVLTRGEAMYRIADLVSDSGTYVNGRRVGAEPVALAHGDIILLGARVTAAFLTGPIEPVPPFIAEPMPGIAPDAPGEMELSAAPPPADDLPPSEPMDDLPPSEPMDDSPAGVDESVAPLWEEVTPPDAPGTAWAAEAAPVVIPAAEYVTSGHPGPLPAMPTPQKKRNGRILLITAGCLLALVACCCSSTLFMYFIGGDWLLRQLSYMP